MLSASFSPGSDFSRLAVSTYGFGGRKSFRGKKSARKPPFPCHVSLFPSPCEGNVKINFLSQNFYL
jgi:hypothetical protein